MNEPAPPAELKSERTTIMVGPSLKRAIESAAYGRNMSVAAWLRECAMRELNVTHPARPDAIESED
jgi:hypothetical protein